MAAEELTVGGLIAVVGPVQERVGPHLEALDLDQDRQEAGIERPAGLGEHTLRASATGELDAAALVVDAHAHLGRARLDAQFAEQPPQVRIRTVVVDDEPGVDREHVAGGIGDVVGVGMAAETIVGFVEGHVVPLREHVGGGQTGDSGADDRDRPAVAEFVRIHQRRPVAGKADAQIRPQPAATAITFARDDGGTVTPNPIASPTSNATLTASAARRAVPDGASIIAVPDTTSRAPIAQPRFLVAGDAGRSAVKRPASRARECGRANVYTP